MKKGVRAADIPRVLRDTHDAGIWTHGFFILGFPGESDVEGLQTLDLILDRLADLDSLVFHDFALPSELAEYVNFAGRVPMDDPAVVVNGELYLQSNVTAVRPWLQDFLAHFLEFAHTYGHLHWQPLGAPETRGVLELYRRRWQHSPTLSRARAALLVARALLAELHARSLTAYPEAVNAAADGSPRRLLQMDADDPIERTLAYAIDAGQSEREAVASAFAARWPMGAASATHGEVMSLLADCLTISARTLRANATPHEHLAPQGFR